jgi:rare lipoprotein A
LSPTHKEVNGGPRSRGRHAGCMKRKLKQRTRARAVLVAGLAALLAFPTMGGTAHGDGITRFWLYAKDVRKHRFRTHPGLAADHRRWHDNHPSPSGGIHTDFHHRLDHRHRSIHRYRSVAHQRGGASWYTGSRGACGVPLKGLYAAHRTWPCGTKVSVRRGSEYVIVKVLDRGPYISGRVIDLSKSAFDRLGSLGEGHFPVDIYRLKR